jgi:hypothetical protein
LIDTKRKDTKNRLNVEAFFTFFYKKHKNFINLQKIILKNEKTTGADICILPEFGCIRAE